MPKREFVKSNFVEWSGKDKKQILTAPPKEAVKFLRSLNSDYTKYDLRKKLHANTIRKIERDTLAFFNYVERPNVALIRPRRANRKFYSGAAQQSGNWKVFAVPRHADNSTIKIRGKSGRNKRIVEATAYVTYTKAYFDKRLLARNPEKEIRRLAAELKNLKHMRVIVGPYMIGAEFLDLESVIREVGKLQMEYQGNKYATKKRAQVVDASQGWDKWLDGLEFATFKNQKGSKNVSAKRKKKTRRQKIRGR